MDQQQKEYFQQRLKKILRLIVILTIAVLLVRLIPLKNDLKCNDVERISIAYLPKGINTVSSIENCDDIFLYKEVLTEKSIYQSPKMCEFVNSINSLEKSNEEVDFDFRLKLLIFTKKSDKPHELCLGEGYLTVLNGKLMKDNPQLFNLLDDILFN